MSSQTVDDDWSPVVSPQPGADHDEYEEAQDMIDGPVKRKVRPHPMNDGITNEDMMSILRQRRKIENMAAQDILTSEQAKEALAKVMSKYSSASKMPPPSSVPPSAPTPAKKKKSSVSPPPSASTRSRPSAKKVKLDKEMKKKNGNKKRAREEVEDEEEEEEVNDDDDEDDQEIDEEEEEVDPVSEGDAEIIDLSEGPKKKGFSPKIKVGISKTWFIYTDIINFKKGNAQGSFEVLCIKRDLQNDKSKPFIFNFPIRYLPKILEAVTKIYEDSRPMLQTPELEEIKSLKVVDGSIYLDDLKSQPLRKTKFIMDMFSIQVEEVHYKTASGTGTYDALVFSKKMDDPKSPGGVKKFSITVPIRLVGYVKGALEYITYTRNKDE